MFRKLPKKFSVKWLLVYLLSLVISGIIILTAVTLAGILIGKEVFEFNMLILWFFVAVANLIVCFFGFFNVRYMFLFSGLAVLIGTVNSALLVAEDYSGWEYFSGVMSLVLYLVFGLIVGMIVEGVVHFKDKNKIDADKKKKTTKKTSILLSLYIILLVIPLLLSLINLQPKADKHNSVEGEETLPSYFSASYSEGNNEYLLEISVDKDMKYKYTEYYMDIDNNGEIVKTVNEELKRELSKDEYDKLIGFIIKEADFMEMPKDISTKENILDAPAAFIELEFGDNSYKKGGYYPFDNQDFKKIKNYLVNLYSINK